MNIMNDEQKNIYKVLVLPIIIVVAVAGSFFGGYSFGTNKTYKEFSVPGLKNKEALNVSPDAIDFAPFGKLGTF